MLPPQRSRGVGVTLKHEDYSYCGRACCSARWGKQVVVFFSVPIHVNTTLGSPVLLLRVDPVVASMNISAGEALTEATGTGLRSSRLFPGLTQFVDVGAGASR